MKTSNRDASKMCSRDERLRVARNAVLSSKTSAIRFMRAAGIYNSKGKLTPLYR